MDLKEIREFGLDSSGSGRVPVTGCCEVGNIPSISINSYAFF
jgi:hypothetical protein